MKSWHSPFRPDLHLRDVLIKEYLVPSLQWLADVNDHNSSTVISTKIGSLWEAGYIILCLTKAKPILVNSQENFSGEFVKRISGTTKFLVNNARSSQEEVNWDNGLFDTAVVTRALLNSLPFESDSEKKQQLRLLAEKAVIWLGRVISNWEIDRYELSVIDLAQILRTMLL